MAGLLILVGANDGREIPELAIQCCVDRFICFEPYPDAADMLRRQRFPNVEIVEAACGERSGTAELTVYNALGLSSSLGRMTKIAQAEYSHCDLSARGTVTVEVVNLADWCLERGIGFIEVLIIDAQGLDLTILRTMEPWLAEGRIGWLQIEADGPGFRHYTGLPSNAESDIRAYLEAFPYSFVGSTGRKANPNLIFRCQRSAGGSIMPRMENVIRLNIGAGETNIEGFLPIDRSLGSEAYPLPRWLTDDGKGFTDAASVDGALGGANRIVDDSVDEIRASHILEHFSFPDVDKVLTEWLRVLKPGGQIKIAVPDYDIIQEMRWRRENPNCEKREDDEHWPLYLMGGQTSDDDFHRSMFTKTGLTYRMLRVGFVEIEPWRDGIDDAAQHPVSLRLAAQKPITVPSPLADDQITVHEEKPAEVKADGIEVKIAAVMSVPRLGWNDNWGCVIEALAMHGIPINRYTGAFWNQCIQNALEDLIEKGVDWALTIDYDTLFTWEHTDKMLGALGMNPQIHALAALQLRRGDKVPLMTTTGGGSVDVGRGPFRVKTAHFGLTLIRLADLAEIPKPWFHGEPDKDGSWSHWSRLDPDIYFWNKWAEHGKTVYVEPAAQVGHLELMVSEYDENFEPRHVSVGDWRKSHKGANETRKQDRSREEQHGGQG